MEGGFSGKETKSLIFAAIYTILPKKTKLPVKLRMDRDDDILITGKRHDFYVDYETGFNELGVIEGLKISLHQDAEFHQTYLVQLILELCYTLIMPTIYQMCQLKIIFAKQIRLHPQLSEVLAETKG